MDGSRTHFQSMTTIPLKKIDHVATALILYMFSNTLLAIGGDSIHLDYLPTLRNVYEIGNYNSKARLPHIY